jgi:hypothetical protein
VGGTPFAKRGFRPGRRGTYHVTQSCLASRIHSLRRHAPGAGRSVDHARPRNRGNFNPFQAITDVVVAGCSRAPRIPIRTTCPAAPWTWAEKRPCPSCVARPTAAGQLVPVATVGTTLPGGSPSKRARSAARCRGHDLLRVRARPGRRAQRRHPGSARDCAVGVSLPEALNLDTCVLDVSITPTGPTA